MTTGPKGRLDKQARFLGPQAGGAGRSPRRTLWVALAIAAVLITGSVGTALAVRAGRSAPPATAAQSRGVWPPADAASADTPEHAPYPQLAVAQGVARMPLTAFDDGQAHFYRYMNGEQAIELFVVRDAAGVVRVAFNACDVCYRAKRGYSQDGDVMVCGNCGNRFPIAQIGLVQGGCNPTPLAHEIESGELVIGVDDIVAGARLF